MLKSNFNAKYLTLKHWAFEKCWKKAILATISSLPTDVLTGRKKGLFGLLLQGATVHHSEEGTARGRLGIVARAGTVDYSPCTCSGSLEGTERGLSWSFCRSTSRDLLSPVRLCYLMLPQTSPQFEKQTHTSISNSLLSNSNNNLFSFVILVFVCLFVLLFFNCC